MEKHLNFEALLDNLTEMIKEAQLKLGYAKEPVRLYYPLDSLNHLLDSEFHADDMLLALERFSEFSHDTLGGISVSEKHGRFCILIPEFGAEYVHQHTSDTEFLKALIDKIRDHGLNLNDILEIFRQYSDRVICMKIAEDEFDYLIYFEDGIPDSFRYCIKFEGAYATYHRFTPKDYEVFGFTAYPAMP